MEEEGKGPLQPALCRERLGAPRPSPAGRSGGRGDPSLVGAGPSSHCAGGRHRKGLRAAGAQHPPHTAGLTGPLLHQRPGGSEEADNSGSSAFPAIPVPGLGLRRQTGVRKGARGAGRGQPAGGGLGGGVPFQENPSSCQGPQGSSQSLERVGQEPGGLGHPRAGPGRKSQRRLRDWPRRSGRDPGKPPSRPARSGTRSDPRPPPRHPKEQPRGLRGRIWGRRGMSGARWPRVGRRDSRSRGACASADEARGRRAWRTARTERAGTAS